MKRGKRPTRVLSNDEDEEENQAEKGDEVASIDQSQAESTLNNKRRRNKHNDLDSQASS